MPKEITLEKLRKITLDRHFLVSQPLPEFDPLTMGHKDKSRLLDAEHYSRIFQRLATVKPAILLNRRVGGTWDYSFADRSLKIQPFDKVSRKTQEALQKASESLQHFLET